MNIEDLNFTLPTPDQIDDVNLWIDATDSSSVITLSGTNELDYWSLNKVNPDVKLYAHPNNRPETGENIGDLNAIDFNRNSEIQISTVFLRTGAIMDQIPGTLQLMMKLPIPSLMFLSFLVGGWTIQ